MIVNGITSMVNNYKARDIVFAKENPEVKLIVRRYVTRIYYCKVASDVTQKERVFFERELMNEAEKKELSIKYKERG